MYLIKVIQGQVAGVHLCCYVLCVADRALGVSVQDYQKAGGWCACVLLYCLLRTEPLVCLIKIIQGLVAGVPLCCYVLCVGGRALGVSDHYYQKAGGWCAFVLLYTVCWGQSPWCI